MFNSVEPMFSSAELKFNTAEHTFNDAVSGSAFIPCIIEKISRKYGIILFLW